MRVVAPRKTAEPPGCGHGATYPVGSKPKGASPFGVLDMIGNVWEWMSDCYDKTFYGQCTPPCRDPKSAACTPGGKRVTRGHSYGSKTKAPNTFRASFRGTWAYKGRSPRIGFRCVKAR